MAARMLLPLLALSGTVAARPPPRVIFHVIVDDLGSADVSWHRGPGELETPTPHLQALVDEGVRLERHYAHYTCTPSRSAFLSGRLPVHVQFTLDNPESPSSGIPRNMTTIASKLNSHYFTAVVGKYDAGMATPTHTPEGRGFNSSLIYYEHKNDFWNSKIQQSACQAIAPDTVDLWDSGAPARSLNGSKYEEFLFRDRLVDLINGHDGSPLFLLYTPHAAHCPLQVPADYLARWNSTVVPDDEALCAAQTPYIFPGSTAGDYRCRAQYSTLVGIMDENIGIVTDLLKAKGWWNETLVREEDAG